MKNKSCIINILGDPVIAGETYNKDGKVTDYLSLPMVHPLGNSKRGKFRLRISVKSSNVIEKISLADY